MRPACPVRRSRQKRRRDKHEKSFQPILQFEKCDVYIAGNNTYETPKRPNAHRTEQRIRHGQLRYILSLIFLLAISSFANAQLTYAVHNQLGCSFKIRINYLDVNNGVHVWQQDVYGDGDYTITLPGDAVDFASVQMRTAGGTNLTDPFSADVGYHTKICGGNPPDCLGECSSPYKVTFEIAGHDLTISCGICP